MQNYSILPHRIFFLQEQRENLQKLFWHSKSAMEGKERIMAGDLKVPGSIPSWGNLQL